MLVSLKLSKACKPKETRSFGKKTETRWCFDGYKRWPKLIQLTGQGDVIGFYVIILAFL